MPDLPRLVALADEFNITLDALVRPGFTVETARGGCVDVVTSGQTLRVPIGVTVHVTPGWEYKSKRKLLGVPLVHINCGYGLRRAKGIIAIGNVATGLLAVGGIGVGLVSFSGLSIGFIALGGLAAGALALGGLAVGLLAMGGCALGVYAMGGAAIASQVAVGGAALAPVSAGCNADAGLIIDEGTTTQQIARYLRTQRPHLWGPLLYLLSLGG